MLPLDHATHAASLGESRDTLRSALKILDDMLAEEADLRAVRARTSQDNRAQRVRHHGALPRSFSALGLAWVTRKQLVGVSASYGDLISKNEQQTRTLRDSADAFSAFLERVAGGDFNRRAAARGERRAALRKLASNLRLMVRTLRDMAARVSEASTALGQATARILTHDAAALRRRPPSRAPRSPRPMAAVDEVAQTTSAARERVRLVGEASRRSVDVSNGGARGGAAGEHRDGPG